MIMTFLYFNRHTQKRTNMWWPLKSYRPSWTYLLMTHELTSSWHLDCWDCRRSAPVPSYRPSWPYSWHMNLLLNDIWTVGIVADLLLYRLTGPHDLTHDSWTYFFMTSGLLGFFAYLLLYRLTGPHDLTHDSWTYFFMTSGLLGLSQTCSCTVLQVLMTLLMTHDLTHDTWTYLLITHGLTSSWRLDCWGCRRPAPAPSCRPSPPPSRRRPWARPHTLWLSPRKHHKQINNKYDGF